MPITVQAPTLQYLPIPLDVAERARRSRKDEFGHVVDVYLDRGPCRVCLRIPTTLEELLLISYKPLADRNPYAEIGPIFIHAHDCVPYDSPDAFPDDFVDRELVIRAYDAHGRIFDATVAAPNEAERHAKQFLSNPAVEEVHVRHRSYTCFDFKIMRKGPLA